MKLPLISRKKLINQCIFYIKKLNTPPAETEEIESLHEIMYKQGAVDFLNFLKGQLEDGKI